MLSRKILKGATQGDEIDRKKVSRTILNGATQGDEIDRGMVSRKMVSRKILIGATQGDEIDREKVSRTILKGATLIVVSKSSGIPGVLLALASSGGILLAHHSVPCVSSKKAGTFLVYYSGGATVVFTRGDGPWRDVPTPHSFSLPPPRPLF